MNKNISVWRGSEYPPTLTHLWIKDDNNILIYKDGEWEPFVGDIVQQYIEEHDLATTEIAGLVKLLNEFPIDPTTHGIIPPTGSGVAASPQLVYSVTKPATTEQRGTVVVQHTFQINPDTGGIVPPSGSGVAASPQLVYNALATAKNYTDELIRGIPAPLDINIEEDDDTISAIDESLTFSKDFKLEKDNKMLYINWLEVTKN